MQSTPAMPAWILLFAAVAIAIAVVVALRAGNRATTGFGVVAGIAALLLCVMVLRSRHAYQAQAAHDLAIASEIAATEARARMQALPMAAPPAAEIPDAAIVEPAPRAPEPDDDLPSNAVAHDVLDARPPSPTAAQAPEADSAPPAWIRTEEGWQPDGNYYVVVSATGRSIDECWNQLFVHQIPVSIYLYAQREIGGAWPYPSVDRDLAKALIVDQHFAPYSAGGVNLDGSFAMHQLHVRLHFNPAVRERLLADRAEVLKSSRVAYTAWCGVLACCTIGIVFGYLKLDAMSNGIHSRRFWVAAIILLGVAAFCGCLLLAYFVQVESYGGLFAAI